MEHEKFLHGPGLACVLCALMSLESSALLQRADVQGGGKTPRSERGAHAPDADEDANVLPEIAVEILGPISNVRGHEWTRGYDLVRQRAKQPVSQTLVERPHDLVVRLPSGRSIRHASKATFFKQERGTVVRVSLMPHLGPPMQYQDAIKVLETLLEQWDAEPNERTKESLAQWKAEGDLKPYALAERRGSAVMRGEEKVGIYLEIRSTSSESGWYIAVDVAATLEEERKLWGSPNPPAGQPTTSPAEQRVRPGS